jgi:hypothetical protein
MGPIRSIHRTFKVAAIAGGLLAFACSQAQSATTQKLFNENWKQKEQCVNEGGTSGTTCEVVSGGEFTIDAKFPGTGLSPSLLSTSGTAFEINLAGGTGSGGGSGGSGSKARVGAKDRPAQKGSSSRGGSSVGTGYVFQDANVSTDFTIKTSGSKTTATKDLTTQKCNAQGKDCKSFKYETIELTITKQGELKISITAKTGADFNGDTFENSIDAENFDGDKGPVSDSMFLQVDLGTFSFNDADAKNVTVSGTAETKTETSRGSSVGSLSDVTIDGKFQP